jgi:hypothetical protein
MYTGLYENPDFLFVSKAKKAEAGGNMTKEVDFFFDPESLGVPGLYGWIPRGLDKSLP